MVYSDIKVSGPNHSYQAKTPRPSPRVPKDTQMIAVVIVVIVFRPDPPYQSCQFEFGQADLMVFWFSMAHWVASGLSAAARRVVGVVGCSGAPWRAWTSGCFGALAEQAPRSLRFPVVFVASTACAGGVALTKMICNSTDGWMFIW